MREEDLPNLIALDVPNELLTQLDLEGISVINPPKLRGPDLSTAVTIVTSAVGTGSALVTIAVAWDDLRDLCHRIVHRLGRSDSRDNTLRLVFRGHGVDVNLRAEASGDNMAQQVKDLIAAAMAGDEQ